MRKVLFLFVPILALALPARSRAEFEQFMAVLDPLNHSGVHGTAFLTLDGNQLTVNIQATGLEANQVHPQHIHGLFDQFGAPAPSSCPTAMQDTNHDGFIGLGEGKVTYGPILLNLTKPADQTSFPKADAHGNLNFTNTYNLSNSPAFNDGFSAKDLFPLTDREIVLHGLTVPAGIFDNLDSGPPSPGGYSLVLPVACGEIEAISAVPEPASAILLGLGACGFLGYRRRRGCTGG